MFDNATVREYLWSSLVTFVASFAAAILPTIGSLPLDQAAIFGLFAVATRAGVRAVLNLLTTKFSQVSSAPVG